MIPAANVILRRFGNSEKVSENPRAGSSILSLGTIKSRGYSESWPLVLFIKKWLYRNMFPLFFSPANWNLGGSCKVSLGLKPRAGWFETAFQR